MTWFTPKMLQRPGQSQAEQEARNDIQVPLMNDRGLRVSPHLLLP